MRRFILTLGLWIGLWGAAVTAAPPPFHEQVFLTPQGALTQIFGKELQTQSQNISLTDSQKEVVEKRLGWISSPKPITVYTVRRNRQLLGYALVVDEIGKYHPITFMVAITPELTVKGAVVLVYREEVGAEIRKPRFLNQFLGKRPQDPLVMGRDLTAISGATLSSWAAAAGIKRALILTEVLIHAHLLPVAGETP